MQEHPPHDLTPAPLSAAPEPSAALPSGPKPASEAPDVAEAAAPASAAHSSASVRDSGAGWFYWIAAISFINTLLIAFNSTSTMSLGLGATMVVDAISQGAVSKMNGGAGAMIVRAIELLLDGIILGFFVLCGSKARKGKSWAFIAGGLVLLLDMLLVLVFKMWISVALHAWALFSIFAGWQANKTLMQLQAQESAADSPWVK